MPSYQRHNVMSDANKAAEESLQDEVKKFGFNRPAAKVSNAESEDEDEEQDMGDLEDSEEDKKVVNETDDSEDEEEEEDESEESDDDSESDEDDESDEEEDEEEETDDEESSSKTKKGVPFKAHNKLRKELGDTKRLLDEALEKNKSMEAKLPDDFQERVDTLAKEIGVNDPENLKKIINLIKEVAVDKNVKNLEEKITKLENQVRDEKSATIVDEFPTEWESFETQFTKEYPNATTEQIKSAREAMRELAGSEKTGGKPYVHPTTGKKVLDPYPLDYIFFKHRSMFDEMVTGKKKPAMESARGGRGNGASKGNSNDDLHLSKNASAESIRALDKKLSRMEADGGDNFRSPENSTI